MTWTVEQWQEDRDRHRANEKRLRNAIFEFGLRYDVGSDERQWASNTLYQDLGEDRSEDFTRTHPLPPSPRCPICDHKMSTIFGSNEWVCVLCELTICWPRLS